jgi:SM-20-related protein
VTTFSLNPDLDADRLRAEYEAQGHVQLMPFIGEEQADALAAELAAEERWLEIINSGEKLFELDRAAQASLSPERRMRLEAAIALAARHEFQHRYEAIRVDDDPKVRRKHPTLLNQFALFLSSRPVVELMRTVTGAADIAFADAQATAYRPGDFLTSHDDLVAGKGRRAAYVFGLTEGWRADWGGLLMFHDRDDDVRRALLPRFNCLNLFAVPQPHSVSLVAPWAGHVRLSVTGWLRNARPK